MYGGEKPVSQQIVQSIKFCDFGKFRERKRDKERIYLTQKTVAFPNQYSRLSVSHHRHPTQNITHKRGLKTPEF